MYFVLYTHFLMTLKNQLLPPLLLGEYRVFTALTYIRCAIFFSAMLMIMRIIQYDPKVKLSMSAYIFTHPQMLFSKKKMMETLEDIDVLRQVVNSAGGLYLKCPPATIYGLQVELFLLYVLTHFI